MSRGWTALASAALLAACITESEVVSGTGSGSDGASGEASDATGATADGGESESESGAPCSECGEECVDLSSDPRNCGECGRDCDGDERCVSGECRLECGGGCGATAICVDDSCVCKPGLSGCDGACVDLDADAEHCGACGVACEGTTCINGQCQTGACDPAQTSCAGACVDPESATEHCGACDNPCAQDELCVEGNCRDVSASACASCPCEECDGDRCCAYESLPTALCVEADECPAP